MKLNAHSVRMEIPLFGQGVGGTAPLVIRLLSCNALCLESAKELHAEWRASPLDSGGVRLNPD